MIELVRNGLADYLGQAPERLSIVPVSGGDIHSSYQVCCGSSWLFVKANTARHSDVLASEFASLIELEKLALGFYPQAMHFSESKKGALLIMQCHDLAPLTESGGAQLGTILAEQHSLQSDVGFGWLSDNYIGRLPQQNGWCRSWSEFFVERRLIPQQQMAERNGLGVLACDHLRAAIELAKPRLDEAEFDPCLVHGDLWGGNAAYDQSAGRPLLFDPAPYYGDPDVDLAMTELFGGFPNSFYTQYRQIKVQRSGYTLRRPIYNLYHALNHFNHFGAGYEAMVLNLCREIA